MKLKNKAAWENCNRRGKKESVEERQRHRNTSIERHKESGRKRIQKSQKKKGKLLTEKKTKEWRYRQMKATKTDIVGKTETKKKQKEVERKKCNFDLYKHFFRICTFFYFM